MSEPVLVAFDLDGTLIDADCAQEWLTFLKHKGLDGAADAESRCAMIMKCYASGHMDMMEYMTHWIVPIAGKPLSKINALAKEFVMSYISPRIFPHGLTCLNAHLQAGDQVILISASPTILVIPIAQRLGITHAIGIEVACEHGLIQHRVNEPLSFRSGKLTCLSNWKENRNLSHLPLAIAYSDSVNDCALLEHAIKPVVVNGDKLLLQKAQSNGWQSISWRLRQPTKCATPD